MRRSCFYWHNSTEKLGAGERDSAEVGQCDVLMEEFKIESYNTWYFTVLGNLWPVAASSLVQARSE